MFKLLLTIFCTVAVFAEDVADALAKVVGDVTAAAEPTCTNIAAFGDCGDACSPKKPQLKFTAGSAEHLLPLPIAGCFRTAAPETAPGLKFVKDAPPTFDLEGRLI